MIGRRFDTRELAVLWAEEETKAIELRAGPNRQSGCNICGAQPMPKYDLEETRRPKSRRFSAFKDSARNGCVNRFDRDG